MHDAIRRVYIIALRQINSTGAAFPYYFPCPFSAVMTMALGQGVISGGRRTGTLRVLDLRVPVVRPSLPSLTCPVLACRVSSRMSRMVTLSDGSPYSGGSPCKCSGDAHLWRLCCALGVPAFEFHQHGPEQQVIRDAGNESSFGDPADKHRRIAALGSPAESVPEFGVGVWGVHAGQYTSAVKMGC